MSIFLKDSAGNTYSVNLLTASETVSQDVTQFHLPLSNNNRAIASGLNMSSVSLSGSVLNKYEFAWNDIAEISLDSGSTYHAAMFQNINFEHDLWSGIYRFNLTLLMNPYRCGASIRFPATGGYWKGVTAPLSVSQSGNAPAVMRLVFDGPSCYFPLATDLLDFTGLGIAFSRSAAKVHNGLTYGINVPIFDQGLYLNVDTATDTATVTLPEATVRTVACQIKKVNGAATAGTIWNLTTNHLYFNGSTLYWTDGTTTVSVAFPASDWTAEKVINILVIEDAAHAVTLAVKATGGSWATATGTLAALTWGALALASLHGSLSNLIQYPYCLTSAEYDISYSLAPIAIAGWYIVPKYAGRITKNANGRLVAENGTDITALLSGVELAITNTAQNVSQGSGMQGRWYVEVAETFLT